MATTKKIIEVEVDVESGEVKKLGKEVKDVSKELKNTNEATSGLTNQLDKMTGGAVTGFKSFLGGVKGVATGFKSLKGAIIATGLGALIVIVTGLIEYFKNFREGLKLIDIAMAALGAVVGQLGSAFMALINLDFSGVADSLGGITEAVVEATNAVNDQYNAEDELYNLRQRTIIQQAELEKEFKKQVKIAGDTTLAVKERLAAVDAVDRIQRQILENEQKEIDLQIEILEAKLKIENNENARRDLVEQINQLTADGIKKETELQEQKYTVDQQKRTIQAEQEAALQTTREENAKKNIDFQKQLRDAELAAEKREDEFDFSEITAEIDAEKAKVDEIRKGEQELTDFLSEENIKRALDRQKADDEDSENRKKRQEDIKNAAASSVDVAQATLGSISALNQAFSKKDEKGRREAFKREKALGIASAVINTAKSAVSAYNSMASIPIVGPVLGPIAAAAAIAAGAAQIKNITKQKYKGESGGGGGGGASGLTASGGGSAPSAPQFNTVGTSGFNQINESLNNNNRNPTKAYVVSGEVSSAQSLDRNRIKEATYP